MRNYDVSLDDVLNMEPSAEKAIQLAVYGLCTDGGHHKQWFLEQILEALGIDPREPSKALTEDGYEPWEPGIAP